MLRFLFFALVIHPIVRVVLGWNVRGREHLPRSGPAIIAANHNSHMDTMVLMALFPFAILPKVRPVAAADYWLSSPLLTWFSHNILRAIPIERDRHDKTSDPLALSVAALEAGDILIFFPEGSRGEPEQLSPFKAGLALLVERVPETPVIPIFLHGLGKIWPKGTGLFVPFFCHVIIGEPLRWGGQRREFMKRFKAQMQQLAAQGNFPPWQ